jgi:arylsulfatase A-like enzyme
LGWEPLETLSEAELRHVRAHYAGEVTMVDRHLGIMLDRLAASGREADTAVIITCDHGTNLGAHRRLSKGGPIYDQVGHQVLMVRGPGVQPGRRAALVQPADTMPTILDWFGLPVPEACQGSSFKAALDDAAASHRSVAVSGAAIDVSEAEDAYLTVQDERWCMIDRPDPAARELYDKEADPEQAHNVAASFPQEAARLHEALLAFLRQHEAHPALVRWFTEGIKGDTSDYRHRPPYLESYQPYFQLALDEELHEP